MDVITGSEVWNEFTFSEATTRNFRLGNLDFVVGKDLSQWRVGSRYGSGDYSWIRYVAEKSESLILKPALPDKPVVVRPRETLKILPSEKCLFFARIPPLIKLLTGKGTKEKDICGLWSINLSHTWFGDPTSGELCYSLLSTLTAKLEPGDVSAERIIIPLTIKNESQEILDFQRICMHVEFLSLYQCKKGLWTNDVEVIFRGSDQGSQITPMPIKPKYDENPILVSPPQVPPGVNLLRKSFSALKYYTGF